MKSSLTLKTFAILFSGFMIILLFISLFQIIFFKEFYEKEKIQVLVDDLSHFGNDFLDEDWFDETYFEAQNDFDVNNNANLYYYKESYNDTTNTTSANADETTYVLTVKGPNEHYDKIYITTDKEYKEAVVDQNLKIGQTVFLRGFEDDLDSFLVHKINKVWLYKNDEERYDGTEDFTTSGFRSFANYYTIADIESFNFHQAYVMIPLDEATEMDIATSNKAYNTKDAHYMDSQGNPVTIGNVTYVVTDYPNTNLNQVELQKPIVIQGELYILYATASLQSIDEVTRINQQYYPYFIGFAVILSMIISLVYSKMVSRPIVTLTKVAEEMTAMNFEVKSHMERDDEIGQLSKSINVLSTALENAMGNLVLTNQKLEYEYSKIAKQEKKRKEFIANVSHELKTPLGVIKSFTEGIKDGIKKEKQSYYIDVILDEANKMDQLIIELLQLSKLDAGKIIVKKTDFETCDLIQGAVDALSNKFIARGISVNINNQADRIFTDYERMEQVLLNLLDNAAKYATEGTEVVIDTYKDHYHTYIRVFNHCEPLSEEQIAHIWDRFYKLDESHNRQYTGTGLGLSIVKSTISAIEAWIEAKGTEDGIQFIIKI